MNWPVECISFNRIPARFPDQVLDFLTCHPHRRLRSGHFDPYTDSVLNPAAFSDPDTFTFGNTPRTLGDARGFAYLNEDISIIKVTNVNDRVSIEFRADFLNIFNRTAFGLGTGGDMYGSALNPLWNNQSNYPREIQFGLKINY